MSTELRPEHIKEMAALINLDYGKLHAKNYVYSDEQMILKDEDFCWNSAGTLKTREFLIIGFIYCSSQKLSDHVEKLQYLWYLANP